MRVSAVHTRYLSALELYESQVWVELLGLFGNKIRQKLRIESTNSQIDVVLLIKVAVIFQSLSSFLLALFPFRALILVSFPLRGWRGESLPRLVIDGHGRQVVANLRRT